MALSAAQTTSLCMALGIPQTSTIQVFGKSKQGAVYIVNVEAYDVTPITDALTARLAAIAGGAEETALIVMIAAWDLFRTLGTGDLETGDIGDIGRITFDPVKARLFLREQMMIILGIYIEDDWRKTITGQGGGGARLIG